MDPSDNSVTVRLNFKLTYNARSFYFKACSLGADGFCNGTVCSMEVEGCRETAMELADMAERARGVVSRIISGYSVET